MLHEAKELHEALIKTKAVSKMKLIDITERYNETEGELIELQSSYETIKDEVEQVTHQLAMIDSNINEDYYQEINDINAKLLEVRDLIANSSDRVARLTLIAPSDGLIKGLNLHKGSVISPGGSVLEIIPVNRDLIIEASVTPTDIGYVQIGQPVDIQVSAYDYATFGQLNGTITSISPSTYLNENNIPFYKVNISINHIDKSKFDLIPGMTVTAKILTGKKSFIRYLTKPVARAFHESFDER